MDNKRLLELAGVQLNEELKDPTIRKAVGDLLAHVNKVHGEIIKAKQKMEIPTKLEDALYQIVRELDKFVGEN